MRWVVMEGFGGVDEVGFGVFELGVIGRAGFFGAGFH